MIALLTTYKVYVLTLHILSMSLGLGAATVGDILFFRFLRDYKITKKEVEVLNVIKNMVMLSFVFIAASGIGLYLTDNARYNASPLFLLKALITTIVIINGIVLHHVLAPHFLQLNFHKLDTVHTHYRRIAFALGAISVISWYSAFFIAMLKSEFTVTFTQGFVVYSTVLIVAIIVSQIVGHHLVKKAMVR